MSRSTPAWLLLAAITLIPVAPFARAACYQEMSVAAAHERLSEDMGDAVILDVRTAAEFGGSSGHVAGALLVPVDQLDAALSELGALRERPVIVICRSGNRSVVASRILCRAGFSDVHNLSGGMNAWLRAGLPVARN